MIIYTVNISVKEDFDQTQDFVDSIWDNEESAEGRKINFKANPPNILKDRTFSIFITSQEINKINNYIS